MPRAVLLLWVFAAPALAGCAAYERLYTPVEYHPVTEVPKGPGLFTGPTGVWTICCGEAEAVEGETGASGDESGQVLRSPDGTVVVKRRRGS